MEKETHDKVRHDQLNVDPKLLGLFSKGLTPSLEERFASRVSRQHCTWNQGRERADSENETGSTGEHGRKETLGREKSGFDVL